MPSGPVPTGFFPLAYSFVDADTGFVLGSAKTCAKRPCTSVLRTDDAGRTFKGIPAPLAETDSGEAEVSNLSFADERNGFAWGPGLFSTHDGGASWKEVRQEGQIDSLAIGGDRVYAALDPCTTAPDGDGAPCDKPQVLLAGVTSGDALSPVAGASLLQDAEVVTQGDAVFVTSDPNSDGAARTRPELLVSSDGRAFAKRTVPCNKDSVSFTVAASGEVNLAGLCSEEGGAGMARHQVFVSSDAGRRWTRVGDPPSTSGNELVATGRGTFFTNRNGVNVTRDGGKTWPLSFKDTGGGAGDLGFVNEELGFLIDQQRLFVTRDAGQTWRAVAFA